MALNCSNNGANVVPFESLNVSVQSLLREAVEARNFSYSPYSNFQVGACLETTSGKLYRGCNVENASYTVGTCAERCALFKAISEGERKFKQIAVVAFQEKYITTPCGACRQLLSEFGHIDMYISKPQLKQVLVTSTTELLPHSFQINDDFSFK